MIFESKDLIFKKYLDYDIEKMFKMNQEVRIRNDFEKEYIWFEKISQIFFFEDLEKFSRSLIFQIKWINLS